jgi:hypothetical protein
MSCALHAPPPADPWLALLPPTSGRAASQLWRTICGSKTISAATCDSSGNPSLSVAGTNLQPLLTRTRHSLLHPCPDVCRIMWTAACSFCDSRGRLRMALAHAPRRQGSFLRRRNKRKVGRTGQRRAVGRAAPSPVRPVIVERVVHWRRRRRKWRREQRRAEACGGALSGGSGVRDRVFPACAATEGLLTLQCGALLSFEGS